MHGTNNHTLPGHCDKQMQGDKCNLTSKDKTKYCLKGYTPPKSKVWSIKHYQTCASKWLSDSHSTWQLQKKSLQKLVVSTFPTGALPDCRSRGHKRWRRATWAALVRCLPYLSAACTDLNTPGLGQETWKTNHFWIHPIWKTPGLGNWQVTFSQVDAFPDEVLTIYYNPFFLPLYYCQLIITGTIK